MKYDKRLIELESKQQHKQPEYEDWTIELVGVNVEPEILPLSYCKKEQKFIYV
jgi:hypothetical protein|tara:strand:- start:1164 stop:1322 length:159 start_codon:yes stop_codon:yes gene_type:complete